MPDDIATTLTRIQVDLTELRGEVRTLAAELRAAGNTQARDLDNLGRKVRHVEARVDALEAAVEARMDTIEGAHARYRGWAAGAIAAAGAIGGVVGPAVAALLG